MKSNGSKVHKTVEVDEPEILEPMPKRPVPRFVDFKGAGSNCAKALQWYKAQPWDEWWDEFTTAIDGKGRPMYPTVSRFVKAKTKNQYQRELMMEMIGPEPPETMRAPWLGDWEKRRASGFWEVDSRKYKSIQQAIKERQDAIEAAKAVGPLTIPHMKRWHRLSEKIDAMFNGEPFLMNLPPDDPKNQARFKAYVEMHRIAENQEKAMWEMWMKAHGLDPSDANAWVTMASMVAARAGAAGALAGAAAASSGQLDRFSSLDLMLAKDLREKSEMYPGLSLPDASGEPATKTKQ